MLKKILIIFFAILITVISFKFFKKNINKNELIKENSNNDYSSNIIKDMNFNSKDNDGNEYLINANLGEIDFADSNIIFLEDVRATIKLTNNDLITITSDYGKYNSVNNDTIFSQNVIINYLENKITGEYLDFSMNRGTMIISRKVVYTNENNIMNSDVIEVDIQTKDTKIFMYEQNNSVEIKSKNGIN